MRTMSHYTLFFNVFFISCVCLHAADRPNIIVIVADDLGWNDISFHGSNQIITPNIDKLAYEGIILNNYYVSPICTPTRGALMSGKHPIHTGLQEGVIFSSQKYGLPLSEKIMPQWFQDLGYRTHMVGKWHLGMFADEYLPTLRGFESHYGYYQGCEDYFDHTYEAIKTYWGLDWRRNLDLLWNETNKYSTELFTNETLGIIKNHDTSEPLFLYLPHQAVHSGNTGGDPLQAPQKYVNRFPKIHNVKRKLFAGEVFHLTELKLEGPLFLYLPHQAVHRGNFPDALQAPQKYVDRFPKIHNVQRKLFAGMLAALDDSIGTVVNALKAKGMYDNSIIVFTTDNGGPANGFDANAANNFPLRGVKATLWEGGVRGVGFVHSPLLKTKGYVSNQMLHVCDWLPTLYKAAGGNPHIMGKLDGNDVWEDLSHNRKVERNEILHNIAPQNGGHAGLRVGDYKILIGDVGMAWDGWYPPWQNPNDHLDLHVNMTKYLHKLGTGKTDNYKSDNSLVKEFEIDSRSKLSSNYPHSYFHNGKPVRVECGPKPANASSNCDPRVSPCLYHIPTDPCEYNNIAGSNKDIVVQMMNRLLEHSYTMVPPLNTPVDPLGNPKYHHGAWVPWVKL